jgi:hypothetical protein
VKLPLFTGGRIINEIKASDLFRLAEENRLSRTRDELVYNVSSTFYAILSQEKVIDSVRFSLETTMARGLKIDCGCGLFFQRQVGPAAILEDGFFLLLIGLLYWRERRLKFD